MKIESHIVNTNNENRLPSYISINPKTFYGVILQLKDNETNQVISEVEISKDAYKLGAQKIIDCMNLVKDEISDRFTLTFFLRDEEFISVQLANAISTLISDIVRYQNTGILYEGDDKDKQEECCCHDCDNCTSHSGDTETVSEDMIPDHSADVENTEEVIRESCDDTPEIAEDESEESSEDSENNPYCESDESRISLLDLNKMDNENLAKLVELTIKTEFSDVEFSKSVILNTVIENSWTPKEQVTEVTKKRINAIIIDLEKQGKIKVTRAFVSKNAPTLYKVVSL